MPTLLPTTYRKPEEETKQSGQEDDGIDPGQIHHRVTSRLTTEFSSGAACEDFIPRKAVMPAPSAATAGSACPWLVEDHRTTSQPRRQPRVGQPCRGQACADTPAAPRRAGTRRQRPGRACPRRSAVRYPPATSGSAPR